MWIAIFLSELPALISKETWKPWRNSEVSSVMVTLNGYMVTLPPPDRHRILHHRRHLRLGIVK